MPSLSCHHHLIRPRQRLLCAALATSVFCMASGGNALATHAALLNAGIETSLLVQKGGGKADFTLMFGAPEAKLAYNVISRFFDQHLAPDHSTDSKRRGSEADRDSQARA